MSETQSKTSSLIKIFGGFVFCLLISLAIYLASIIFIYAAWHCPHGNCQTKTWADVTVFLILASPLLIFALGAYFCRNFVFDLTANKFLRILILLIFAFFPIIALAGWIIYIVETSR